MAKIKLVREENFSHIKRSPRGGFYQGLDYPNLGIEGNRFHYVCDAQGVPQTDLSTLPWALQFLLSDWTEEVRTVATEEYGAVIGETCIRISWYPTQAQHKLQPPHKDLCWLTIPLYDNVWKVSQPFWGEMAEHTGDGLGLPHLFRSSNKSPRIYVCGFVQMPFSTICENGRRYYDVMNELIYKNGMTQNHLYSMYHKVIGEVA